MGFVVVTGWRDGFQRVSFTRLMKTELGLTLKPAKTITDRIMEGELVELEVPDEQVEHLLKAMTELGAICEAVVPQQ